MPKLIDALKAMHRAVVWVTQVAVFALAGWVAFLLRFDFILPHSYLRHLAYALPIWILVKVIVFRMAGLDRGWWRYVSAGDLTRIVLGNLIGSTLSCLAIFFIAPMGFARSIYLLDLMICFLGTAGVRLIVRLVSEATSRDRSGAPERNTLIYGAGAAGVTLLREIQNNPKLPYRVRGFLDDRADKKGIDILGVPVLAGGDQAAPLAASHDIAIILIAIPSATGAQMTRVLEFCHAAGVECKTVPGLGEVIEERGLAGQIRDVAVEDLLGRVPVRLEETQIRIKLEGQVVMVTGAAGSIGSELCRQIARFQPAAIVGFECAETALFYIEREMRENFPDVPFHPAVGDIRNRLRVSEVMAEFRPSVVYHAAAYKHVPMMESHAFEAVENNVIGTWNVADAASKHEVADFVMISSDKAVRPTSVMGVTKRIAEMLVSELHNHYFDFENNVTNYVSVRFGNVLGSNGSVIPLFKQQIAARKPVAVTDPEMRRYFMTIPEASQLVLQASTMGKGGEIFVLDMGEPVKILDLARKLILLSGLRPGEDIPIVFTGLRPGEKLYEELAHIEEETRQTYHAKIKIFAGNGHPNDVLFDRLNQLRHFCETRDLQNLILQLKEIVPEYNPSSCILRQIVHHPTRDLGARAACAAVD